MREMLILILEDEFSVSTASDGKEALKLLKSHPFDLCILDLMMPYRDGMEVLGRLSEENNRIPVIILSARTDPRDRVTGLEKGADDYVIKPFDPNELIARVKSVLRRTGGRTDRGIRVDREGRTAYVDRTELKLTRIEFDLLEALTSAPKRAWSRSELVERVWGLDFPGDERIVDTHVKNLREKLKKAGETSERIKTVWSYGYKWRSPS
ncbi:hypothetical protein CHM34_08300 [Paludifilum halophilum]|uniref:DNA-binding response regulator n=2 Tax=Paludifilum halophilum TaxID=1642702 RepID=A0A235B7C5_9BACL|nr:hypothetical protein CHM34_08300 [Paludifilum halophilum]